LGLKAHRFALKAGQATASSVKRGVSAFKKVVVGTIRQVFQSLATSGWGRVEGSGESMVYIPHREQTDSAISPVDRVDDKYIRVSTAVTPTHTGIQSEVDKIDKIDTPPALDARTGVTRSLDINVQPTSSLTFKRSTVVGFKGCTFMSSNSLGLDEPHPSQPDGGTDSIPVENNQFINSLPMSPMRQGVQPVDGTTQCEYQPSTESSDKVPQLADEDGLLNDDSMAAWYQRLNACQTLDDATDFYTAMEELPSAQRHQFESSVPDTRWAWLFNLPEFHAPESSELELVKEVLEPESVPEPFVQPTLDDLIAPRELLDINVQPLNPTTVGMRDVNEDVGCTFMSSDIVTLLLACDSLVKLNEIKLEHKKNIGLAYRSMTETEKAHVDALRALAVPHKVFKYLGEEIRQGTERLIKGTLVYIDPLTLVRSTARSAKVWAINGVPSGWQQPVEVSLNLLKEVVKVVLPDDETGGQQMGLI